MFKAWLYRGMIGVIGKIGVCENIGNKLFLLLKIVFDFF